MAKCDMIGGIIAGIFYAKRYPDFMEFDIMRYHNPNFDHSKYSKWLNHIDLQLCEAAALGFLDRNGDFRESHIDDLKRIVWYASVCLDEERCLLDRNKAYRDLKINELVTEYVIRES